MAFHVACPITCRRICYCSLGFLHNEKGETDFLNEITNLKSFLDDPWRIKDDKRTVQVLVPKVVVAPPPPVPVQAAPAVPNSVAVVDGDDAAEMLSAQNKRAAMQKQAAAASLVAEDFARRFESGETEGITKDVAGGEQVVSNGKVMCRLCFSGENERSERARKMLSCKSCNKKYHRSCVKSWSHDRDLFHWSSWSCPSCRVCEVCRRTGDPNKLMFCKRCDGAYHCYCQHPPHKNVSRGPYLCPKHTKCHSCASTVPGNGSSLRWFLGYTCCDACGRLFVKGNYCPVCLKVYRDSEATPMVCCDICQRWVHCHCDGISDDKYLQYQVNNHLEYRCATCRGECYQVRDHEDAVQELWRRRDIAEQDLIASLRAAAGLPTQEEIFAISPYSDDEDDGPPLKKEYGHSLKFSLKGVVDKSPKKNKDSPKKAASKKYGKERGFPAPLFGRMAQSDAQSVGSFTGDYKDEDGQFDRFGEPNTASLTEGVWPVNREGLKRKLVEVPVKADGRLLRDKTKSHKPHQVGAMDDAGKEAVISKNTKGPKLVIHLGGRNKNVANSTRSDASNSPQEQIITTAIDQKTSFGDLNDDDVGPPLVSHSSQKERKSVLRLKFKNPYSDDQSSWASPLEEDKSSVKGQRSKRKRSFSSMDRSFVKEDKGAGHSYEENDMMSEIIDAKWIIQKLGKHAIGKMVEVHQPSNNFWYKGTVIQVSEDTSTVSVTLDDGKAMNVDLGKQRIRFVSQKQRQ
uniref:uncharacterized protein LOC122581665 n=1 Tax=Erigeron canadensis TaxID=72917 RepID=UPI001CB956E2|nr:uncharacterized protein LOC122581665 [Erigeron canadensis]